MRKQYSAAFKAQIVLEALKEIKTVAQIASEHQLHPNLVTKWKQEACAGLSSYLQFYNQERPHQSLKNLNACRRLRRARPIGETDRNITIARGHNLP